LFGSGAPDSEGEYDGESGEFPITLPLEQSLP